MIRKELKLGPNQVAKDELLALWKALDADGSGLITSGEFGQFMKLGAPEKGLGWKALRTQRKREEAQKVIDMLDAEQGRHVSKKLEGVEAADQERVVEMSKKLNEALNFVPDPAARSWVKLFNKVDEDGSGKMAYREFMRMASTELKQAQLSKPDLASLWKALDADNSGLVTIGEFGQFMKLGMPEKGIGWKAARTQRNREAAKSVIAKLDAEQGRNVSKKLAGVDAASEYQVVALSAKLNEALQFVPDPAARSWVKLFNKVDEDGSGKMAYREFMRMASTELKQAQLSKPDLASLWKALDADNSGLVTIGEFGQFMKLGMPEKGIGWKAARTQRNREAAKSVIAKLDAEQGRNVSKKLAGVDAASEYQVVALSAKLNEALQFVPDPAARSWVKLFNKVDEDGSGQMAYREFMRMVRSELKQGAAELPKDELLALWKALDADGSGLVTIGEFGQFMKLGAPEKGPGWREQRTMRNLVAKQAAQAESDAHAGRDITQALAGVGRASDDELVAFAARLLSATQSSVDPAKGGDSKAFFKIFSRMDPDRSGKVDYGEFTAFVRTELGVAKKEMAEVELKSIWKAIDADGSGQMTADEFSALMRRGAGGGGGGADEAASTRRSSAGSGRIRGGGGGGGGASGRSSGGGVGGVRITAAQMRELCPGTPPAYEDSLAGLMAGAGLDDDEAAPPRGSQSAPQQLPPVGFKPASGRPARGRRRPGGGRPKPPGLGGAEHDASLPSLPRQRGQPQPQSPRGSQSAGGATKRRPLGSSGRLAAANDSGRPASLPPLSPRSPMVLLPAPVVSQAIEQAAEAAMAASMMVREVVQTAEAAQSAAKLATQAAMFAQQPSPAKRQQEAFGSR